MCRQFTVKEVYLTTGPATSTNHDGEPWENPDLPVGTLLAEGVDGEWYRYRHPERVFGFVRSFGFTRSNRIKLFRDYWQILESSGGSPYSQSIRAVPKTKVEPGQSIQYGKLLW